MYLYLWFILIYAFLGWCAEVAYAAVNTGKFVNRGFLNGAVCPIYGVGAVIIIAFLTPLRENIFLLFLGSVLLTSALEWFTGWAFNKIFSHKWWDYSDLPFNIGGYTCLKFSLMWGLVCLLVMNVIHPIIQNLVLLVDIRVGQIILIIFYTYLAIDIVATVQSIFKLSKQLKQINRMAAKMRNLSDYIGEKISSESILFMEKTEELKTEMAELKDNAIEVIEEGKTIATRVIEEQDEKLAQMLDKSFMGQKRILQAFPNMKSKNYNEELKVLKKKFLK
jgi:Predicted membrane protein